MIGLGLAVGISRPRGLDLAAQIRATVFGSGEQGLWLDFFDTATTYQDAARTTPATAVADVIGAVADKSGNGNNATQVTTASKMTLRLNAQGKLVALSDGFDDFLATAAIDFSGTNETTVFLGIRKLSAVRGIAVELSADTNTVSGSWNIQAAGLDPNEYFSVVKGSTAALSAGVDSAIYNAPHNAVITFKRKISTDVHTASVNGVAAWSNAADQGTGNSANAAIYIGRRAGTTLPANLEYTSLIVVDKLTTAAEDAVINAYIASAMGITL